MRCLSAVPAVGPRRGGLRVQLRTTGRYGLSPWSLEDCTAILNAAGLRTVHTEHHDEAFRSMIETIEARFKVLCMTGPDQLADAGINVEAVLDPTRLASEATANGTLGYALITAEKPRFS